ncbi:MAG: glycosyl transferase [Candidatus Cloacimonadota bacterium]|nr:MAG: glycosyl transferase [Candidatus Cloacimonadota bacterium]
MRLPITAIILTLNEEKNLPECISSIEKYVNKIIIVDSFSNDNTKEIAEKYNAEFIQNKWINYSQQFQWGLDNTNITTEWVLRIDADERWTEEGFSLLAKEILKKDIDGVFVKIKIFFMERWISHGAIYPNYFLRVFRKSKGKIEQRWMDEHIQVEGKSIYTEIDVIEYNYDRQSNIGGWTEKHNSYALREAIEYILLKENSNKIDGIADRKGGKTAKKRWLKEEIYGNFPLILRPLVYFFYRFIIKLGFLDGKEGFIFHFLQGFWYRFLVDVKIIEIERKLKKSKVSLQKLLLDEYGTIL